MSLKLLDIKKRLEKEELKIKFLKLKDISSEELFKKLIIDCLVENNIIEINTFPYTPQDNEKEEPINQQEYKEDIISIRNKAQLPVDIPTNITRILIDGKTYNIDLVKVSKWTLDIQTKQLKLYKAGIEKINDILSSINLRYIKQSNDKFIENIASLYWNITVYFEKIDFKDFKSKETKHIYQLLCIFYGVISINQNINRDELFGELLKAYNVTKNNVDFHIVKFKSILKNSFISELFNSKAVIPDKINEFDMEFIYDIIDSFIKDKILEKDIYTIGAIAFYIEQLKGKTIHLTTVQKILNIENISKLNKTYSIVVNYINKNKNLKRKILRKI